MFKFIALAVSSGIVCEYYVFPAIYNFSCLLLSVDYRMVPAYCRDSVYNHVLISLDSFVQFDPI